MKASRPLVFRNSVTGQTFHFQNVQHVPEKNVTQKRQWVKAVATIKPATFTQKAVVETELYYLPFMEAVQKAQLRWPNVKSISYQTLPVTAAQKTEGAAPAEKAE